MNVVVPLNIAALRVSDNDNVYVVGGFKGRTATFEDMPSDPNSTNATTGDMIVQPLEGQEGPRNSLGVGIHLHWELPDHFRRGVQSATGEDVAFPDVPNRWLVIRYLSVMDNGQYDAVSSKSWIVQSDYVSSSIEPDPDGITRPAVTVPLPINPPPNPGDQAYRFMGRVMDYDSWSSQSEDASTFLPAFNDEDGKPLRLTSIGFVGPGFASYYPECCSVFGFWDHFKDQTDVYNAITGNIPIQFRVSYQVIGWVSDPTRDPIALCGVQEQVTEQYTQYLAQCLQQKVVPTRTPAEIFTAVAEQTFRWTVQTADVPCTLNPDYSIKSLDLPERVLCAGVVQEVVCAPPQNSGIPCFLKNPSLGDSPAPSGLWSDTVELATGNTTIEALSALLKTDMGSTTSAPDLLTNYECLLDALQLGLLLELEQQGNSLVSLEEALHSRAFSKLYAGQLWVVRSSTASSGISGDSDQEITLPAQLAEQLDQLNAVQKEYDQARASLDLMRRQLFMDWFRYVKLAVAQSDTDFFNSLTNFLETQSGGELHAVVNAGNAAGVLLYSYDPDTNEITGVQQSASGSSCANAVCTQYQAVADALKQCPTWQLTSVPAPPFWLPTDPVLLMEGDRVEPVRRNGATGTIAARLGPEILTRLALQYSGSSFSIDATSLAGLPQISAATPMQSDVQALVGEAYLLVPMLASACADALRKRGGTTNPAVANYGEFVEALQGAQGGSSPLEGGSASGLFAAVHASDYSPAPNPSQNVSTPLALSVTFSNGTSDGWPPNPVAWNAQQNLPTFDANRYDPFLPVFLIWELTLDPLIRNNDQGQNYSPDNLTQYFTLNTDGVDYVYNAGDGNAVPFTGPSVTYSGSVALSKRPIFSLTSQIDVYVQNYPHDPADTALEQASETYASRNIMSQALSGFSVAQTLRTFVPKVPVMDLVEGAEDQITADVAVAATAAPNDNWYDFGFNGQQPVASGPQADNFGPLRAGFAQITHLEVVDIFGQRLQLNTQPSGTSGILQTIAAMTMQPVAGDNANANKIFLPPRLLVPARVWFRWLSADDDDVEMNTHPATSPICGWLLPNHLDNSLFIYDADGTAIGSVGIEHDNLVYRTRPGNSNNPNDSLATDIGEAGQPKVNAHLSMFLWYLNGRNAAFLADMMKAILGSDSFINPANFAQNANLAVLLGRPLALTRAVLGLETPGGLLPLSQAEKCVGEDVDAEPSEGRFNYTVRQKQSSANLGAVEFPVRFGDLANLDDGLVGYFIEAAGANPYNTMFSPAAPPNCTNGVTQPSATTVLLKLNDEPLTLTMLIDPRAAVHATTGVLPVQELRIPPDQYAGTMRGLAASFVVHPVLEKRQSLVVPLPQEAGYQWSWVNPGGGTAVPLAADAANDAAIFEYSPQTVLEGWVQLQPQEPEER